MSFFGAVFLSAANFFKQNKTFSKYAGDTFKQPCTITLRLKKAGPGVRADKLFLLHILYITQSLQDQYQNQTPDQ